MGLDAWGRWHVVYVDTSSGALRYMHEGSAAAETIDTGLTDTEAARVDLAIDADGFPHVVWFATSVGELRYATILDE